MNLHVLIASLLCFLLGIVHSFLGEYLIFKNLRKEKSIIPTIAGGKMRERHLRIIWATWHLASIMGVGIGVVLWDIAIMIDEAPYYYNQAFALSICMLAGSLLVLYATKGRHPGWIVLLIIAVLLFLSKN